MTKKLILALLAQSAAMADGGCAPEMPVAAGNSWFGVGVDMGAAFLHGSVSQKATDTLQAVQKTKPDELTLYLAPNVKSDYVLNPNITFDSDDSLNVLGDETNPIKFLSDTKQIGDKDAVTGALGLKPMMSVVSFGGKAEAVFGGVPFNITDSSKKTQSTSTGFVGQLSFHYMTKMPGTMVAVGLHAGIGYNGARSSVKMPIQTMDAYAKYTRNIENFDAPYINFGDASEIKLQGVELLGATNPDHDPDHDSAFCLLRQENLGAFPEREWNQNKSAANPNLYIVTKKDSKYKEYTADGTNLYAPLPFNMGAAVGDPKTVNLNSSITSTNKTGKATISSGLMLQAGTRLGAMIGNLFPHIRVGWAAYQLKAQITNQTCLNSGVEKEKSYSTLYGDNAVAIGGGGLGLKVDTASQADIPVANINYFETTDLKVRARGEYTGSLRPDVGSDLSTRTVNSKYKWTNALTLGAGIDWAYQNMTFGLYYQAAICQKVNFDNWKSDIVTGTSSVTSLSNDNTPEVVVVNPDTNGVFVYDGNHVIDVKTKTKTAGTSKVTYTTGKPATVSMSPVFNTVMLSVKYCFKAA